MASKRRIRRRSCSYKRRYETEAQARRGIWKLHLAGKANGFLATYRCKFCGGYHFGHTGR